MLDSQSELPPAPKPQHPTAERFGSLRRRVKQAIPAVRENITRFMKTPPGDALEDSALLRVATNNVRAELKIEEEQAARLHAEAISTHDPLLTNLLNKAAITSEVDRQIKLAKRDVNGLMGVEIELIDLDHFGKINQDIDHQTGDRVLVNAANIIASPPATRSTDYVGRFGGEEILVIKPFHKPMNSEDHPGIFHKAITAQLNSIENPKDRIRKRLDETEFNRLEGLDHFSEEVAENGETKTVSRKQTASSGIARMEEDDTPDTLILRANFATSIAKFTGRNRTVVAERDKRGKLLFHDVTNEIYYSADIDYKKRSIKSYTDLTTNQTWDLIKDPNGKPKPQLRLAA